MTWRKSSNSGNSGGQCVEVRGGLDAVRDSKNGEVLEFRRPALVVFLRALQRRVG